MPPTYICIDLKSFYASVECVARGLDPLKARLLVADGSRTAERWETYSKLEKENRWSKIRKNEMMMNIAMERRKMNRKKR